MSTRQRLNAFGIAPRKSLGQNFLIDPNIARAIVAAAHIEPGDLVIEIGPGIGALTQFLVQQAGHVIAIELDQHLIPALQTELHHPANLTIIHADALEVDYSILRQTAGADACPIDTPIRVVGNLPYYITSAFIRRLLESRLNPALIVLTVQMEVAQRIVAEPGQMSLLAVSVQFYGQPRLVMRISPSAFYPQPDVDSAVVAITPHPQPLYPYPNSVFALARAGFSQRRKQLRNTLASGLGITREQSEEILLASRIDPARRAETLGVKEWIALAAHYDAQGHAQTVDSNRRT
ncbi:MAG: 16S rRNA (adenine(1518)-N(6)/adenine(1519)-N(6))-dimethyltransferase RsmA [Anaerolineae bacterium]